MRRFRGGVAVAGKGVGGNVIRKDEDDVGPFVRKGVCGECVGPRQHRRARRQSAEEIPLVIPSARIVDSFRCSPGILIIAPPLPPVRQKPEIVGERRAVSVATSPPPAKTDSTRWTLCSASPSATPSSRRSTPREPHRHARRGRTPNHSQVAARFGAAT